MRRTSWVLLSAGAAVALGSVVALPARAVIDLVPARVALQSSLDAKKAKPGEPITARIEADVELANGDKLPRNTMLEGHVDQVHASTHHSDSSLVVTFDQATLRNGEVMRVKVTIVAIAAPSAPGAQDAGPAVTPDGATGSGYSQVPMPQGAAVPESERAQPMGLPLGQIQGPQWRAAGVPGVALQSDIHQPASATFLSKGRNVRVPAGTEMEVAIAVVPRDVSLR